MSRFHHHGTDEVLFEACEKRLVLSAQLLFDVLGDQALELHGVGNTNAGNAGNAMPVESQLQEAHAATGLNEVREQFGLSGAGQTVAVIDSGIAWDHVALGQGYGPGYRVVGGWDFTEENDAKPYDDGPAGFHGTHVSGIIGSDDPTHPGVAPDVDLVALRVFNDVGQGQLSWVENALQWVHTNRNSFENPITTVNLSIGTNWNGNEIPQWATLEDELQQLFNDGILVTASAGNSFQQYQEVGLSYPAASSYTLPVASVDNNGQLSDFSQRSDRVLAAPGSNIVSSIPDHVMGRDGNVNDFSPASGTSMASPYVAGASVLVRQAMEMTGWESINAGAITDHLRSTADAVFDHATGLSYDVLNLEQAISTLIPADAVGDTLGAATHIDLAQGQIDTWLNNLNDTDVYQFVANANGTLTMDASSDWVESLSWSLRSSDQIVGNGALDPATVELVAGQSYELYVSADGTIGPASFQMSFDEAAGGRDSGGQPATGPTSDLGIVRYFENQVAAGEGYAVTASQDGMLTVQWTNHDAPAGTLRVADASGHVQSVSNWTDGAVRLDMQVSAGEQLYVSIPGFAGDQGELAIANVLVHAGSSASLKGTLDGDDLRLDLSDNGLKIGIGSIDYAYSSGELTQLKIDGYGSNDQLSVIGSETIDKVELRPTGSVIENNDIRVVMSSVEQVAYSSGGGADRVYLYDSDGDDTLRARPGSAELVGVGYRFEVDDVERIYIHATGGGQDHAYLYDSVGDDRLSVRPQFTSISGDGFFNYVRGFERVYAYANAGGTDVANLYDSAEGDRFITSGASASIVGPGFSSFTRSFEIVNAHASEGGDDVATLYGADGRTQWQQGSDFVSFKESSWGREARGFGRVETYVESHPYAVGTQSVESLAFEPNQGVLALEAAPIVSESLDAAGVSPEIATPLIQSATGSTVGWVHYEDSQVPLSNGADASPELDDSRLLFDESDQILRDTSSIREMLASKFHLPEERFIDDPQLEQDVLDEAFRQFDDLF